MELLYLACCHRHGRRPHPDLCAHSEHKGLDPHDRGADRIAAQLKTSPLWVFGFKAVFLYTVNALLLLLFSAVWVSRAWSQCWLSLVLGWCRGKASGTLEVFCFIFVTSSKKHGES